MNIGIVTTWFERGAAYVSKQYRDILATRHKVFIYARGGEHLAIEDPNWKGDYVTWDQTTMPIQSGLNLKKFERWIYENKIAVVFFNEQRWWLPVLLCNKLGIKTGAYIDYYKENTLPLFGCYDFLVCNTRQHFGAFSWHPQVYYVPWGTDINVFSPKNQDSVAKSYVSFFHSAGMNPHRKGCDLVIKAFSTLASLNARLVIHSQRDLGEFFPELKGVIHDLQGRGLLQCIVKTVPAPGLYHYGDIYVYPSRLDGIGLTIAEALACGLPVITSDNPPMSEFVDINCGRLVEIERLYARSDGYYWPQCVVKLESLVQCMREYVERPQLIKTEKILARKYAEEKLDWEKNASVLCDIFEGVEILSNADKKGALDKAYSYEQRRSNFRIRLHSRFPNLYRILRAPYRMIKRYRRTVI